MAQTYSLIQAQTLSANATSITLSNIPQNFTDLCLKVSGRTNRSSQTDYYVVRLNGANASASSKTLYGTGGGASSTPSAVDINFNAINGNTSTANTFGNSELYIPNYTSSISKSTFQEGISENNASTGVFQFLTSGIDNTTSPITSLVLLSNFGADFMQGTTIYLYGIGGARAAGGTITSDKDFTYHTFTSTGTFTALEKINNAEVLLVAGGGGGASGASGPGGGAGGVIVYSGQTLTAGTSYTSLVGAGGTAGTSGIGRVDGLNGNNSSFINNSAIGGGKGGEQTAAGNGGSGGGGGVDFAAGTGISGQGFAGARSESTKYGGGGGGAGGLGLVSDGGGAVGGPGTNAYNYWHTATSTGVLSNGTYFIGGGGGAGANIQFQSGTPSIGGVGGGGSANSTSTAGSGTANTGGGGGGGSYQSSTYGAGGAGGSGLVIIRYPNI